MIVVASITTTGRRIGKIVPTLQSVCNGLVKPDKFVLWLNREGTPVAPGVRPEVIPAEVWDLCEVWWTENWGPATKLIPAMLAFPDANIATLDDDILYPGWWLQRFVREGQRYPDQILCYRARRVRWYGQAVLPYNRWSLVKYPAGPSNDLVPTGVHGVWYPPHSLRPEAFDRGTLGELSLPNDDLWFAATRKQAPRVIHAGRFGNRKIRGPRLSRRNCRGRNDKMIHALAQRFGAWVPWHKEHSNGH